MKTAFTIFFALAILTWGLNTQAGKPNQEEHFFWADYTGPVSGSGKSGAHTFRNTPRNLVFNKPPYMTINLSSYFATANYDQGTGADCFGGGMYTGTMQVYPGFEDDFLMARFWFVASDGNQYVLTLFDTDYGPGGPDWNGTWPPSEIGDTMDRTAESWGIGPTKKKARNACEGSGDFGGAGPVEITVTRVPEDF